MHKLYAHSKRITDLKWSRHADKALLASASLDETVFVCLERDVGKKTYIESDVYVGLEYGEWSEDRGFL